MRSLLYMTPKDWYWEIRHKVRSVVAYFVRGYRGVAPMDTWSFDRYLARVMAQGFRTLAKNHHGIPPFICEEYGLEANELGEALDIDKAAECWADWLNDKATWLEWYVADEIPIHEGMSQHEKIAALNAYDKKYETFKTVILPEIVRRFDSLWD